MWSRIDSGARPDVACNHARRYCFTVPRSRRDNRHDPLKFQTERMGMRNRSIPPATIACMAMLLSSSSFGSEQGDRAVVAALDTEFQQATKIYDAATIDRMLPDDYVLVLGNGRTVSKAELLKQARDKDPSYEKQDELEQTVRVYGDTAVVTAKLWIKGNVHGKPIDYKLWFSDTYTRTPAGWRYVLGQASLPLPE